MDGDEETDARDILIEARIPAAAEIVCQVHDLDPDGVAAWLAKHGVTDPVVQVVVVLLAAMVPDDRPVSDLLAWTQKMPRRWPNPVLPIRHRCSCCRKRLPLEQFHRDSSRPLGRKYRCILCVRRRDATGTCEHGPAA